MPIQIGAQGATIFGRTYAPYFYIDWFTPDQEAIALQGGDATVVPARQLTPVQEAVLASLVFVNVGTVEAPIYELQANVLPRTNTVASLSSLASGSGELASATDAPCIVQLNGPPGAGTAALYSPMDPGTWNVATFTLAPKAATGAGNVLKLVGGTGTTTGGGVTITGAVGVTGASGTVSLVGGASSVAAAGAAKLTGGAASGTATSGTGSADVTGGQSTVVNGLAGPATLVGGRSVATGGAGGNALVQGGRANQAATGTGGSVVLQPGPGATIDGTLTLMDAQGTVLLKVGPTPGTMAAFGAPTAARPAVTGSRSSGAAWTSLLAAMVTLGWVTDSTTA